MALRQKASNLQRRKMLPHIRGLFNRHRRLTFNDERVEIFSQKGLHRLGERTNNPRVQFFEGV
jgi:hypothetical protein